MFYNKAFEDGVSSDPERSDSERRLSVHMIVALLPAFIWSVIVFGWRTVVLTAFSVGFCVGFEYLYRIIKKESYRGNELPTVVIGILLAFSMPSRTALWLIPIGSFVAVFIVKDLGGGIVKGILSPVVAARVFLSVCFGGLMDDFSEPITDAATSVTVLASLKCGTIPSGIGIVKAFLGICPGNIGEVSVLMLLIGGVYLIIRRVITWHVPVAFIGTVAAFGVMFPQVGGNFEHMLYSVFAGGLTFGAFFIASDRSIAPVSRWGKILFGVGCAAITLFIRYFSTCADDVFYAVMIMLPCVYLVRRVFRSEFKR